MPAVKAIARDEGEPDEEDTQTEFNERFNHWTHAPNPNFGVYDHPFGFGYQPS